MVKILGTKGLRTCEALYNDTPPAKPLGTAAKDQRTRALGSGRFFNFFGINPASPFGLRRDTFSRSEKVVEESGLASNYFALDELARWSMIIEKTREFSDRCQANRK